MTATTLALGGPNYRQALGNHVITALRSEICQGVSQAQRSRLGGDDVDGQAVLTAGFSSANTDEVAHSRRGGKHDGVEFAGLNGFTGLSWRRGSSHGAVPDDVFDLPSQFR